ncbi:MAG: hypothetical protein EGR83_07830 [Bacteroides cellulosilyticus]|nr:hypothetical protein [Bacteroides cellulosilyticus]
MKLKNPHMNYWHCLRNRIAYRILKLLGFSIYPNILAGEVDYSGEILYMTISSSKLEPDDDWLVKRG